MWGCNFVFTNWQMKIDVWAKKKKKGIRCWVKKTSADERCIRTIRIVNCTLEELVDSVEVDVVVSDLYVPWHVATVNRKCWYSFVLLVTSSAWLSLQHQSNISKLPWFLPQLETLLYFLPIFFVFDFDGYII